MPKYIRIHAESVLMSWGEYSPGNLRGTLRFPSRSPTAGMCAAGLGLFRGDARIPRLHQQIRVHSRILREGQMVTDYQNHTSFNTKDFFSALAADPKAKVDTRRHERRSSMLDVPLTGGTSTKQSWRDYIADAAYEVVIELLPGEFTLEEVRDALNYPKFFLYFGRKSSSPLYPLSATIVEGASPIDVFRLPTASEVPGKLPKNRYVEGLSMSIDSMTPPVAPDGWVVVPQTIRDAMVGSHGRIFHTRPNWLLVPVAPAKDS